MRFKRSGVRALRTNLRTTATPMLARIKPAIPSATITVFLRLQNFPCGTTSSVWSGAAEADEGMLVSLRGAAAAIGSGAGEAVSVFPVPPELACAVNTGADSVTTAGEGLGGSAGAAGESQGTSPWVMITPFEAGGVEGELLGALSSDGFKEGVGSDFFPETMSGRPTGGWGGGWGGALWTILISAGLESSGGNGGRSKDQGGMATA